MAAAACKAVAAVVAADVGGETLLEVVQLVADLIKRRECRCEPEVCVGGTIQKILSGSCEAPRLPL